MTSPSRPKHDSVVFALAYQTWANAVAQDMSWSADRMVQRLCEDPDVRRLIVADPLRSQLARLRHRETAADATFPYSDSRQFLQPRRWRRRDSDEIRGATRAYSRLDRWLHESSSALGVDSAVLVTCHPVLAAVADRARWADVVYYGWDDWLAYPPFAPARDVLKWSYEQMAARDVNVIGVTRAIVERIGSARGAVVPNGIAASDFENLDPLPDWFAELQGPIALYAGSMEGRVDVEALEGCARDLPHWTFVLVGYANAMDTFAGLAALPNVRIHGPVSHRAALNMMGCADVCLVPHRRTPMSVAMSPLKLFEYLGAGSPVVASDLPPLRGISELCLLVDPGQSLTPAVLRAAALPRATPEQVRQFRRQHDWSERYLLWRETALGG